MSIDLTKNKDSILKVYNDVLDDRTEADWALFGYESQTNVLKVVSSGENGAEELADDLNASSIMYGVVRVTDPKTSRTKIVLINWQGEAAPNLRKGICARHLPDVKKLLKGVHITISARTEDEVDTPMILDALAKATSTDYNFNDRSELPDRNAPVKSPCLPSVPAPSYPHTCPHSSVLDTKTDSNNFLTCPLGTNYKRTNPQSEIDPNKRNRFWEEQEAEEKRRKELEMQKREEEAKKTEKERMEREIHDMKHREELNKERNARIIAEKKAESLAMERGLKKEDRAVWEKEREHQYSEEIERAKRADQMRKERKQEAESLIGKSTHIARAMFEPQPTYNSSYHPDYRNRPPPRVLKEFNPHSNSNSANEKAAATPKRSVGARWPPQPSEEDYHTHHHKATVPGKITNWRPQDMRENTTYDMEQDTTNQFQCRNAGTSPVKEGRTVAEVAGFSSSMRVSGLSMSAAPNNVSQTSTATVRTPLSKEQSPSFVASSPSYTTARTSAMYAGQPSSPSSYLSEASSPTSFTTRASASPPASNLSQSTLPLSSTAQPLVSPTSYEVHSSTSPASYIPQSATSFTGEHINGMESKVKGARYANVVEDRNSASDIMIHNDAKPSQEDIDSFSMLYEVDGIEYQILPEHGLCARALYDYQAADESEITFDPGDIITNIDQIDVGWWQGCSSLGIFGLFPANYVELINGTKAHCCTESEGDQYPLAARKRTE